MQLNKVFKGLMLALPLIAVAACSSNKNDDQTDTNNVPAVVDQGGPTAEELARQQLEQLKQQNTVYFGFDKYDVSSDYTSMLDAHAAFLRANPSVKVVVEGYADERGTPEYNIALGERRANAVKMYLQGKGVSADQMSIVSFGKEKPAVLGHDEAAYAKNRRAVLAY